MGIEPTNAGITIRCVNHFATTAILNINENGAGNRSRTRDLLITSQLLYQLSYTGRCKWWLWTESNRRHEDFQSSALPTELQSHK